MTHLRPLRQGARNPRADVGPKRRGRAEPLHAPREIEAIFAQAKLQPRTGNGGTRLTKVKNRPAGKRPGRPREP